MIMEHDWFPRPLPENVELAERSWLYSSHAFVHCLARGERAVRIGPDSGLYIGTYFELGPDAEVSIGRFCTLVGAIIATNGPVSIGECSFISHEVVIAGEDFARPPAPGQGPSAPIEIGENAWIGTRAVILGGARIGAEAIVGAGAVVRGEVPAGATAAGNPARVVREAP